MPSYSEHEENAIQRIKREAEAELKALLGESYTAPVEVTSPFQLDGMNLSSLTGSGDAEAEAYDASITKDIADELIKKATEYANGFVRKELIWNTDYNGFVVQNPNELELREYQRIGVEWLLNQKRTMLTDQPGLGKTLQSAMAAKENKPVLVTCPTYLVRQWYRFLKSQFPKDRIRMARGTRKKREAALYDKKSAWCVINTAMLRTYDIPTRFNTFIHDEYHDVRNRNSKQAKAAELVYTNDMKKWVFGLTATPIWKEADDLYMLLHILQPTAFPSYGQFVSLYCEYDEDEQHQIKVIGIKPEKREHLDRVLNVMRLGRTYTDVGRSLPPIIESVISVDMNEKIRELYNRVRAGYLDALQEKDNQVLTSYMEVLHSLRRITAGSNKIEALKDKIENDYLSLKPENRKPIVVFTWYKDSAGNLANSLAHDERFAGLRVICITGDVPVEDRADLAMQGDIVIANIQSLSVGVNLQHCGTVAFFEEHWPPGANYQAMTRVRRDRQDDGNDQDPVLVYYIQCARSIDEYIHIVSKTRGKTIKDIVTECLA